MNLNIVTIERQQEVICALSNGDISNDLDGPLTRFSTVLVCHFTLHDVRIALFQLLYRQKIRRRVHLKMLHYCWEMMNQYVIDSAADQWWRRVTVVALVRHERAEYHRTECCWTKRHCSQANTICLHPGITLTRVGPMSTDQYVARPLRSKHCSCVQRYIYRY